MSWITLQCYKMEVIFRPLAWFTKTFRTCIPLKIILYKIKISKKLGRIRTLWYLVLHTFWKLLPKFFFFDDKTGHKSKFPVNFLNVLIFSNFLIRFFCFERFSSLKNLKVPVKAFIIGIKIYLTCDESNLFWNVVNYKI